MIGVPVPASGTGKGGKRLLTSRPFKKGSPSTTPSSLKRSPTNKVAIGYWPKSEEVPPKVASKEFREGWDRIFGGSDDSVVSETINPCRQYGPGLDPKDLN